MPIPTLTSCLQQPKEGGASCNFHTYGHRHIHTLYTPVHIHTPCLTNRLHRRALPPHALRQGLLLCWSSPSLVTSMPCLEASHHLDHLWENVFLKRGRLRNRDLHLGPQGNYQMANGLFSLDDSEQLNQAYWSSLDFVSNEPRCFTSWKVCSPLLR